MTANESYPIPYTIIASNSSPNASQPPASASSSQEPQPLTVTCQIPDSSPPWLVNGYYLAGISVGLVAIIGLIYALKQTNAALAQNLAAGKANEQAAKANELAANTAKAQFIFELDKRWEGSDMADARKEFTKKYEEIHTSICSNQPKLGSAAHLANMQKPFADYLSQAKKDDIENYSNIMKIMGFFETAGMLIKQNYIPLEDILELYTGSLLQAKHAFSLHVTELAQEKGGIAGIYENCVWLFKKAEDFATQKGWNHPSC